MNDIVCIGTAILDVMVRGFVPEPVSARGYISDSCTLNPGGEAVNVSTALAALGVNAKILCFLGRDHAGKIIAETLKDRGVDTGSIVWEEEHATPVTTMFLDSEGGRKTITNRSHQYNFHPERYMDNAGRPGAIMLGSLFRAPFDRAETIREVLLKAESCGSLIFADTKIPNFRKLGLKDLKDLLPMIDFITPNEEEAGYYTGREDVDAMADTFLSFGVKNVIIKLGGRGCYFKNRETAIRIPGYPVQAVDTTGAGDNFIAGFASELVRGTGCEEALRFANACGAVCTSMEGATTALKNRGQVLELLSRG